MRMYQKNKVTVSLVPGLILILCCFVLLLWGISRIGFSCSLSSCSSDLFSIVIILLGEQRTGLCAFRAFVSLSCMC